jgi:hypothetical protein
MAVVRNAHQVAEEMGNSVVIVRRHYDAVLEPLKVAAWWEIIPGPSLKPLCIFSKNATFTIW